ncbi:ricin-type beta-trefoil lectin domain protein [Kitasatospora sp. NPDC094015]|uniref:ricin-type beta-trefoil lectin domain protein n=1 Tax=Kitasatospora sp. NPDC094015 TaxID=3155205 RepID=UPI003333597E
MQLAASLALAGLLMAAAPATEAAGAPAAAPVGPMSAARTAAAASGKPVTVEELTTETSQTVANADGTFSLTTHILPTRVKRNGAWTSVDATLARNGDGTLSPKATPSGLALSGGGTGPLATLTDAKGRRLSLTFPVALPAPSFSGDSATYSAVLPGVDLRVIATDQGGLREVLVVRDAAAAANPQLRSLQLATSTSTGLTLAAGQDDTLTARSADGSTAFAAPAPVMWDSSTGSDSATARMAAPKAKAAVRGSAPAAGNASAEPTSSSTEREPGTGAKVKPIAVTAEAGTLTLTPDAGLLTGPDTVWPLYIDPSVNPITTGTNHFATVKEGCPGQRAYDVAQDNGQGVGYQHWDDCQGLYQSFFELNTGNLTGDMVVSRSEFHITESYGASFDCNHSAAVSLATVSALASDVTWNLHRPSVAGDGWLGGTQYPKSSNISNHCGNHDVVFDVTGQMQKLVGNSATWTVGIYGNETKSSGNNDFMRFNPNPYVITVFDIAPEVPDGLGVTPAPHNPDGNGCDGAPGWIGDSGTTGGASNITLNAHLSTKMSGVNLRAGYHVWDDMVDNGSGGSADASWPVSTWVANGGTVYTNIGGPVSDGHQYGWNTWANDGTLNSGFSRFCYFKVDLTAPSVPAFTENAAFPPIGGTKAPTGHAGDTGAKVTVTANDPTPGGCTHAACISSGIDRFEYSLDADIPAVGAHSVTATATGGGNATAAVPIDVPSNLWGAHTLFVRAVDKAGNTRATVGQYSFFAPWNPTATTAPGDLTGDGSPDLAATSTDGNLLLIPGGTDPGSAPTIASTPAQSPGAAKWSDFLIAHRGSVSSTMDDLFAFNKTNHELWLYPNDGSVLIDGVAGVPGHFTNGGYSNIRNVGSCPAKGSDGTWNRVTQILATGALAQSKTPSDLITVDNKELWYYPGTFRDGCFLGTGVRIGTGDWSNFTVIAPGTVGGTPTLWARDNSTGAVTSYPLTFTNGIPTTTITAPGSTPLISGVRNAAGQTMCLDGTNSGSANGTPIQLWNCNGTGAQKVTFGTDRTVRINGKCLDAGGGTDGAAAQIWDCNGSGTQQWEAGPTPGSLKNSGSGRCLDDPFASNTQGNRLVIWGCNGEGNQKWTTTADGTGQPAQQNILAIGGGNQATTIASPGDIDADGYPDLYTTTGGEITRLPGAPPTGGLARFGAPVAMGAVHQPADRWTLTDTADSVRPANSLTLTGAAAITAGRTNKVLGLDGKSPSTARTAGPVLTTTTSYTVSAWAYLTDAGNYATVVGQSGTNVSTFYLQYSKAYGSWAFVSPDSDVAAPGSFAAAAAPNPPQLNRWTHLVATYDVTSKAMKLYIDGTLVAIGTNPSPLTSTGPLTIGSSRTGDYFPGQISDVQTWNSALSPATVAALDTDRPNFTQLS